MQKLVYVLPEYRKDVETHFFEKVEFLKRATRDLDIFLILEKGVRPDDFQHVYIQKFRFLPLRILELFFVLLVLRMRGYRIFWTHYSFLGSIIAPIFGRSFYWNCGLPWLYRRGIVEERIFRLALTRSLLVTGTEKLKRLYRKHYHLNPQRVKVLSNWINLARFLEWQGRKKEARSALAVPEEKKVILFLHRLSKRKGADLIVPIAKQFENHPDVLFLVAGSGPLESAISGPNVKLVGSVSNVDVPVYMTAADVFFMPSEEEGFPNVLLEAMALGVPIVVSDVGGVCEMTPSGLRAYIVPQSVEIFSDKIKELLANHSLRVSLGREEQKWATRYDIDVVLREFLKLIGRTP